MEDARTDDALSRAALAVSAAAGSGVFERLATELADILRVDVGFIAVFADPARSQMRMLAFSLDGRIRRPFEYPLERTPCASVVGRQFRSVASGARKEFPENDLFGRLGLESYAAYPLNDLSGEPLGLIGAMHRKPMENIALCEAILKIFAVRAGAEIESSEEQYRAIFNAVADSLVLRDADFRVVDVNPAYEAISGRPRAEALGRNDLTMSPPELNAHVRGLHQRALAGEPVMFEALARRKNGERFDIETRGVPILHQGQPHVLYIGRDITARKRAEDHLRASEEQYRAIFNATTDALVLRDAERRVVDVNPAFLEMSGYTREEVLSGTRWFFARPDQAELAKEMHRRVIAGESVQFEVQGIRKDGTPLEVEMRAVPMLYRGQPHALGMARDITARQRADAERARLEDQLRQAQRMEAIGRLTGGIAHDFNNLLAAIMGYVVLAAESEAAAREPKLAGHLEEALAASRRARDLIQQMLIFSRGQRGAARPLALADAVAESLKLLRSSLPSTLELRTRLKATAAVLLDPVQVDQVLLNLSINARDAMNGVGRIEIALRPANLQAVCASCRQGFAGEYVELALADSGPGIAPEVLERMFEPFFTTKEVGRGAGMGLATVHGIVHEHGGHIVVETAPSSGTRFRLLWPMLAGEAAPASPAARPKSVKSPLRGRVLVVDDEAAVGRFMRELLESWGLEAVSLTSPARAKEACRDYDLVITDQTMPGTTGYELAKELIALRPGMPVILYTGHSERITQSDLAAAGIRALLHKPVEPDLLYGLLRTHLSS
jgi:PAS domain S-box-containing protein